MANTYLRPAAAREVERAYNSLLTILSSLEDHTWSKRTPMKDTDFIVAHHTNLKKLADYIYRIHHTEPE